MASGEHQETAKWMKATRRSQSGQLGVLPATRNSLHSEVCYEIGRLQVL